MKVHGREVKFSRTVQANIRIIEELAGGNPDKVKDIFNDSMSFVQTQTACAKFIAILSEGYEASQKYINPDYEPRPVTKDEALLLSPEDFSQLFDEALQAWTGEKVTVETEPVKKTARKQGKRSS